MGIYIKDMKSPASCCKCRFSRWSNYGQVYMCNVCEKPVAKLSIVYESTKPDWCPIIEIHRPHGRLIDADALLKKTINNPLHAPYIVENDIRDMLTVIEGSKENEKNNSKTIN